MKDIYRVPFSDQLERWLETKDPKTIQSLTSIFAEKSFAIVIFGLMFLPSLPLPSAGISHVFEIIVMLLAAELIIGRRTIWLPKRLRAKRLGTGLQHRVTPLIMRRIRWFERYSRPRLGRVINHPLALRFIGVLFLLLALTAFTAPPFVALDTLPSLGAVIIALSLILEDALLFVAGCVIGAIGIGLVIGAGGLTLHFLTKLVNVL
jgi:hypothetical protein